MYNKLPLYILWVFAFCVAIFTQTTHLLDLPGLHFDEAWQGLFAHKISVITDFYPMNAMNSYTSPVLHYLMAIVFKFSSPSLLVMRSFFSIMNLLTLLLLSGLVFRISNIVAAAVFCILWALLPLSFHNHRFYIELTSFHGLCFSIFLWGCYFWKKPWSPFVITLSVLAGVYSHILFITVFFVSILISYRHFPDTSKSKKFRTLISSISILCLPIVVRMAMDTKKMGPYLLVAALLFLSIHIFGMRLTSKPLQLFSRVWNKYSFILSMPVFALFTFFHFDGRWPLLQATSILSKEWLPINSIFLILTLIFSFKSKQPHFFSTLSRRYFLSLLILVSILILKQSPRFMTLPMIVSLIWISIEISNYRLPAFRIIWLILFCSWNMYAFFEVYQKPFLTRGALDSEIKIWLFKDSARDFRPFQKVYSWASSQGCAHQLSWVEDDRFLRPIEFLRLTEGRTTLKCPFSKDELFFSHIPGYSFNKGFDLNKASVPTPQVKLFHHQVDWGDLAIFQRKK